MPFMPACPAKPMCPVATSGHQKLPKASPQNGQAELAELREQATRDPLLQGVTSGDSKMVPLSHA